MTKDDYTGLAEKILTAYKNYDEGVDEIIDPYSEDNDNIAVMTTLQLNMLQEIYKVFDEGSTDMGPEFIRLLKQFSNCLIMECSHRASKLAKEEGANELKCEHILKSMDQITLELPL
ncbi:PREDICTED: uncharacterized protein LOC106102192 [Papilio polytes]|uniref:uncharacterized protein LOC106102192 n=1 Tax=Papilio polytes TaxID=76194 RepID=UPI0006760F91|nr:PREDICTED: uncharacterized protein LOC106102192 [Papilio polytes]